jgi:hypothetical protein
MQLNELRMSNDELRKQLTEVKPQRPFTSELVLADAEAKFTLQATFYLTSPFPKTQLHRVEMDLTWNEIIGFIGPTLLSEPRSDDKVNEDLAKSVCSFQYNGPFIDPQTDSEDFKTVKIQLLALGYVTMDHMGWAITPLGTEVVFRMRTVQAKSSETE